MASTPGPALATLGDESFVSLTTFRTTGAAVSTAVWVARDGDSLLVITPSESGKVKRLRNSGRVEVQPCNRAGTVPTDAPVVAGVAEIVDDPAAMAPLQRVIEQKYGFEYKLIMGIERLVARRRKPRVILRITAPVAA